eukprot:633831-Amphidinium_carterae.1
MGFSHSSPPYHYRNRSRHKCPGNVMRSIFVCHGIDLDLTAKSVQVLYMTVVVCPHHASLLQA